MDQRSSPGRTVHPVTGLEPGRERVDPRDGAEAADGGPAWAGDVSRGWAWAGATDWSGAGRREILRLAGLTLRR